MALGCIESLFRVVLDFIADASFLNQLSVELFIRLSFFCKIYQVEWWIETTEEAQGSAGVSRDSALLSVIRVLFSRGGIVFHLGGSKYEGRQLGNGWDVIETHTEPNVIDVSVFIAKTFFENDKTEEIGKYEKNSGSSESDSMLLVEITEVVAQFVRNHSSY